MSKCDSLMNTESAAYQHICSILSGKPAAWPSNASQGFAESFLTQADYHGVAALLFDQLHQSSEWEAWPVEVKNELGMALREATAYDMLRTQETDRLFTELARLNVPFLVIKGDAIGRTHYPRACLRSRGDTDLFISPTDIDKTIAALENLDFEVFSPIYKSHQFSGVSTFASGTDVAFDIHWRLLNSAKFARKINFTRAMERSIALTAQASCRTLCVIDALLLACMHRKGNDNHDENRLVWLYDIHLLVTSMTLPELRECIESAVELNIQAVCLDGLREAHRCFNTLSSLNSLGAMNTAKALPPNDLIRRLELAPHPDTLKQRFGESNLGLLCDDFRCLPTRRARLALLRELFFPTTEELIALYQVDNRRYLPLFYLRYIGQRLWARLTLR